jgi:membrane protease YdiL (CAAX protease family)
MSTSPRALSRFFVLTFAISWAIWAVCRVTGADVTGSSITWLFAIGASGPTIAAIILWCTTRRRTAGISTRWRRSGLWAPASALFGAAPIALTSWTTAPDDFASRLAEGTASVLADSGGVLLFVATYLVAGPLAEEFGWRGFAQPRLRQRFGLIGTSLVLGAAWALWHVPLYLLPGTGQNAVGLFSLSALLFFASCVPLSAVMLVVSERLGGGVASAVLLHFVANVGLSALPLDGARASALYLGYTVLIAVVAALAFWEKPRYRAISTSRPTAIAAASRKSSRWSGTSTV